MLRSADNQAEGDIPYHEAMRLARRGEIEGVGPGSGRIRFLRRLKPEAIEENPDVDQEEPVERQRSQPMNAVTNLGAYRQQLETRTVWALCLCKGLDGARA